MTQSREAYLMNLVSIAIYSAANPCPICMEAYDEEQHLPVLLLPCGHIFGRPCILQWFAGGANTCPLDRIVFFTSTTESEVGDEHTERSPVPSADPGVQTSVVTGGSRRVSADYFYLDGEIIGVNGQLTRDSCFRVVKDLWYCADVFFRQMDQCEEGWHVLSLSGDVALPRGISIPDGARALLDGIVRAMMGRSLWEEQMTRWDVEWLLRSWGVCVSRLMVIYCGPRESRDQKVPEVVGRALVSQLEIMGRTCTTMLY